MTQNVADVSTRLLWAKSEPHHLLWRHLLDAAAVAKALLPRFWPDASIPETWLLYLVAIHDVGKADPLFQSKAPDAIDATLRDTALFQQVDQSCVRGFRHERRSAEWVRDVLLDADRAAWGRAAVNVVAAAIQGHHGNFHPARHTDEHEQTWGPLRGELAALVWDVVQPDDAFCPRAFDDASTTGLMLSGLIVLSDWIASGTDPYAYHTIEKSDDPATYFKAACERAEAVVARLELGVMVSAHVMSDPLHFEQVWPKAKELRHSQQTLQDVVGAGVAPGLAIIEAPMGEGKTEAAVYLAEEWHRQRGTEGVYFALPTMATSNQMHERYAKYLRERPQPGYRPRLVHGMSWLIGDQLPEVAPETDDAAHPRPGVNAWARSWFASPKRALLAPQGVGTVDQAMMSALLVKHGFLRLFGLARKVLIIDEVHAYDAFMQTILRRLLQWCRVLRVPVILLSATLSRAQRADLLLAYTGQGAPLPEEQRAYPLLTFAPLDAPPFAVPVQEAYTPRHVKILRQTGALHDVARTAKLVAERVAQGGCVCVLVNTVRRAQQVFAHLTEAQGAGLLRDTELLLFHARFTAKRRDTIEKTVVGLFGPNTENRELSNPDRPTRAILVCTQVVEQSLDVCFDEMLTDLAPVDLLLQRSGRMYRHTPNARYGREGPQLHVLLPGPERPFDFGRIELRGGRDGTWRGVYDRAALLRTMATLSQGVFELPKDFRTLIEGVYSDAWPDADDALHAELKAAEETRLRRLLDFEQAAKQHLIPDPDAAEFSYAKRDDAVEEAEDGQKASYFRAQTRLGDDTRAALVLTDPRLIEQFAEACERSKKEDRYQPTKKLLKALFWQKANVPAYWLGATPREEHRPFAGGKEVPAWARGHTVIFAPHGRWEGTLDKNAVTLRVDDTLGLVLENAGASEQEGAEGA